MELIAAQYRGRARVLQAKLFVLYRKLRTDKHLSSLHLTWENNFCFCVDNFEK
ncbi:MAG: hypothetical protein II838_08005 [Lachnospiraceae bacterium]|jgi:hypothetical protein|nr:hypothetical protein [Lachnospiraceae bacterium]